MNDIKLSEMEIGDYGIYDGDIVMLRNGGLIKGCSTDIYLAYYSGYEDEAVLRGDDVDTENLPDIIIDTDTISV